MKDLSSYCGLADAKIRASDKNLPVHQKKKPCGTWQFGKIGVLVNFVPQELKSKHLVCLSFLW